MLARIVKQDGPLARESVLLLKVCQIAEQTLRAEYEQFLQKSSNPQYAALNFLAEAVPRTLIYPEATIRRLQCAFWYAPSNISFFFDVLEDFLEVLSERLIGCTGRAQTVHHDSASSAESISQLRIQSIESCLQFAEQQCSTSEDCFDEELLGAAAWALDKLLSSCSKAERKCIIEKGCPTRIITLLNVISDIIESRNREAVKQLSIILRTCAKSLMRC